VSCKEICVVNDRCLLVEEVFGQILSAVVGLAVRVPDSVVGVEISHDDLVVFNLHIEIFKVFAKSAEEIVRTSWWHIRIAELDITIIGGDLYCDHFEAPDGSSDRLLLMGDAFSDVDEKSPSPLKRAVSAIFPNGVVAGDVRSFVFGEQLRFLDGSNVDFVVVDEVLEFFDLSIDSVTVPLHDPERRDGSDTVVGS